MSAPVERHLEVVRTARYWVLGGDVADPTELWVVLHGYQQLAGRFVRRFQPLADGTRVVVAPEALSRFYTDQAPGRHGPDSAVGASWMTREDRGHEIGDYVRYLDRLVEALRSAEGAPGAAGRPAPRLTVLGFSQGVATAARWTALGRTRAERLVLWGDFLPPDLDLVTARRAWQGTDVALVRGDRDGLFADAEREREESGRLAGADLHPRRIAYAGGHEIDSRVLARIAAGD